MRDELLPDNCTGQEFADKVNTLIRDHNPYTSRCPTSANDSGGSSSSSYQPLSQAKDARCCAN
eukprot:3980026-Pleurochrysis_carterae.AAC.1